MREINAIIKNIVIGYYDQNPNNQKIAVTITFHHEYGMQDYSSTKIDKILNILFKATDTVSLSSVFGKPVILSLDDTDNIVSIANIINRSDEHIL